MAKAKDASSEKDAHVAIKVVGDDEYAQREVAILSELSQYQHPNIIRLIGHYTPDDGDTHIALYCHSQEDQRSPTSWKRKERWG